MRERIEIMQKTIRETAKALGLEVNFSQGKRATDIFIISVEGDRRHTLKLYTDIIDAFPEVDLELFNTRDRSEFGMKVAITRKLSTDERPLPPDAVEKRARWKRQASARASQRKPPPEET